MCCFFRAFVFFAFHKRRDGIGFLARLFGALRLDTPVGSNTEATENPGFLARLFGAFGLGDGVSTSAEAREARRKRIEERTATVDDIRAEIAAQERELSAAVEERKQIDSKLEAADTDKKKYEKKLEECEQNLAAKQSRADIVKLERKKERLEASIAVEGRKQSRLLDQSEPLDARIKELHADIAELKQQMGAWHELTFAHFVAIALVMSFSLLPPLSLFSSLPSSWVLTTAVQFRVFV